MKKELTALRQVMKKHDIDCYVVPSGDFHGSEFTNDYFHCRHYISGFTGSAGTLVVTEDEAWLWTDGRYFLQAAKQLEGTGIKLMKMSVPNEVRIADILKETLGENQVLGFDGRVVPYVTGNIFEEIAADNGAKVYYGSDLVDEIWEKRPELRGAQVENYSLEFAGRSYSEKIEDVRKALDETKSDYHLIPGLEENAWLYNLRGKDVECSPVFFSFTLISPEKTILYAFKDALEGVDIPEGVEVKDYFDIFSDIKKIPKGNSILVPFETASYALIKSIPQGVTIKDDISPVTVCKAYKNDTEIEGFKKAHIKDGVAMVKFLYWLDHIDVEAEGITEWTICEKLEEFRSQQENFRDISFETIAGYGENGAIVHYAPTEEVFSKLKAEGFILIDSGAQYLDGTTDITRTVALGPLNEKMKEYYTAVLKSHILLANLEFEKGTTGSELDTITRGPVRETGEDYNHGTGHGVGHYLSVHEGPQSISFRAGNVPVEPRMTVTDEPGLYIENEFGIRIENVLICIEKEGLNGFLPLTLCPYERRAIVKENLTEDEIAWLDAYNRRVYTTLSPYLEAEEKSWLAEATSEI